MGYCEYQDSSKGDLWNGYYCSLKGDFVRDSSLVKYYCTHAVRCQYCPIRGGDDRDRKSPEPPKPPEPEEPVRPARISSYDDDSDSGYSGNGSSGGSGGGSGGGGGGGSGCLLGEVFGIMKFLVLTCIISAVIVGVGQILNLLGITGTRVYMQLPEGVDPKTVKLYAVNQEEKRLFRVREKKFGKDGQCKLVTNSGHSDIYLEQDGASVWLGTCDLYLGNACTVEDITYEEAMAQMVRPMIIRLHDTAGNILAGTVLQVADAQGNALSCIELGDGQYAVLLPNDMAEQALTIGAAGYRPLSVNVDTAQRLSIIAVSLAAET